MVISSAVAALGAPTSIISPIGADSGTFDRAYQQARSTPVVFVQPGVYPLQRLGSAGHRAIFVARGGVTVGGVELEGSSNVEFRGMRIAGWTVDDADHITFRNVHTAGDFYINAPSSWISVI